MKNFLMLFLLSLSMTTLPSHTQASDSKVIRHSFTIPVNYVGGRVYFSCSNVRSDVKMILQKLKARNIQVTCFGGLDTFNYRFSRPATVRVSFDKTNVGRFANFSIRSWKSCHLFRTAFNELKPFFHIRNLRQTRSCLGANSGFSVLGQVHY